MKKLLILLVVLLIVTVGLVAVYITKSSQINNNPKTDLKPSSTFEYTTDDTLPIKTLGISLNEQYGSKQMGGASLVEANGKLTVTIDVGDIGDTPQPAHIHTGFCPTPGDVVFSLNPVKNGKSETVIETQLEDLFEVPMAINIHKSAEESSLYSACGDIVLPSEE